MSLRKESHVENFVNHLHVKIVLFFYQKSVSKWF